MQSGGPKLQFYSWRKKLVVDVRISGNIVLGEPGFRDRALGQVAWKTFKIFIRNHFRVSLKSGTTTGFLLKYSYKIHYLPPHAPIMYASSIPYQSPVIQVCFPITDHFCLLYSISILSDTKIDNHYEALHFKFIFHRSVVKISRFMFLCPSDIRIQSGLPVTPYALCCHFSSFSRQFGKSYKPLLHWRHSFPYAANFFLMPMRSTKKADVALLNSSSSFLREVPSL